MRLEKILLIIITCLINSSTAFASPTETYNTNSREQIYLDSDILKNESLDFIEHVGPAHDEFASALAMNVQYSPIIDLRQQIERKLKLKKPLSFLKAWNPNGEAHITTVTPVEYFKVLKDYVHISKINQIARELSIQSSDLTIHGLGRGRVLVDGKNEDTYFVIVKSENLLKIRRAIYREFLQANGNPARWNPEHFFPHITVGYTLRDLHETDGVLKDVEHSLDNRFELVPY